MANYGTTTHRSISTSASNSNPTPDTLANQTNEPKSPSTRRIVINLTLSWPFGIPSSPEAAIARIARNLAYFKLYYFLFVWAALFISLIPRRQMSLVLLVIMTNFTVMYLLLLKAMPNSVLLKLIEKRLVFALLALVTAVGLIVTDAGLHLLITLACTTSVILGHAVLQVNDGFVGSEGASSAGDEEIGLLNGNETAEDRV
ncbi:hypothetical protein Ancab_012389 [Ancistrocladus abbreviatus]